jgi:hypothetical protein
MGIDAADTFHSMHNTGGISQCTKNLSASNARTSIIPPSCPALIIKNLCPAQPRSRHDAGTELKKQMRSPQKKGNPFPQRCGNGTATNKSLQKIHSNSFPQRCGNSTATKNSLQKFTSQIRSRNDAGTAPPQKKFPSQISVLKFVPATMRERKGDTHFY